MELQPDVTSPLSLDPYDSSSSCGEATDSSVFDPAPSELRNPEKSDKIQFSFEDTNSNVTESRHLLDREDSDYRDSGISPGVFESEESDRRTLIS